MSPFSLAISPGTDATCFSMKATPPFIASGRVRFTFVFWEVRISRPGLAAAYTWFPCQWSQWKCVLIILRTGFC